MFRRAYRTCFAYMCKMRIKIRVAFYKATCKLWIETENGFLQYGASSRALCSGVVRLYRNTRFYD